MDNSFLVGLSAQQVLQKRMDTTANNLANLTTAGFKAERPVMREITERPAAASEAPTDVTFVDAWTLQRDFSAGPIEMTGNPLDVAVDGDGFFVVQTQAGPAYTRDGRFALGPGGELVTHSGDPVMGEGGPITLDAEAGEVTIGKDGAISQNNQTIGKLQVVVFDKPEQLEKMGGNLWKANGIASHAPERVAVTPGAVEGSNVNAVSELTQMIEISRSYESVSKMISQSDELRADSIQKLAQVG
jgi:flagellar basal-body rod protein FlgF